MKEALEKIYQKVYQKSPKYLKSFMSKSNFFLMNKPLVEKPIISSAGKFPSGYKGGFMISADFELGWAFRYSKTEPYPQKKAVQSRLNFPFLIEMFEKYKTPITWGVVGHLLLKECHYGDHDWMHPIPYFENAYWKFDKGNWFDCDPYTKWEMAKEWYAPDLVSQILNSKIPHEIGCHTFSHIDFSYKHCPYTVAEDEMRACLELAKEWNISLKSFVFPAGTYGNFEVLKKYGFLSYRKSLNFELSYPYVDEKGLVVIPSTKGLEDNGLGWSAEYFIRRYKKYINRAITSGTLCHFWFHPSFDEWFMKNVFPSVLEYATAKRDTGELWLGTMSELAEYILFTRRDSSID